MSSNLFLQLTSGRRFTMYLQVSRPAPSLLGSVCIGTFINIFTYHSRYLDATRANGAGKIHDSAQRAPTLFEGSLPFSGQIHGLYGDGIFYDLGKAEDYRLHPT